MLARIAHELYWIGRYLARAEHTARMLDGAFRVNLQAAPDDDPGATLSWESLLAIVGAGGEAPASATSQLVAWRLTLDDESPASIVSSVVRARAGARTVRDVISTEMWEVVNTFERRLRDAELAEALQTGPFSIQAFAKERCALFWGLAAQTMLSDEAAALLGAGRQVESAGMVVRMLRVAVPRGPEGDEVEGSRRDGGALALLHAVGGLEAFRRSVTAPPNALPVACFLVFERRFPHSVAASIEALHDSLSAADPDSRASAPALRLSRLAAELEFRRRGVTPSELERLFEHLERELGLVERELEERYFAGALDSRQLVTT